MLSDGNTELTYERQLTLAVAPALVAQHSTIATKEKSRIMGRDFPLRWLQAQAQNGWRSIVFDPVTPSTVYEKTPWL